VTPDRLWPIALDAIFAAFLWSGHNIAAFDLTIGLAPAPRGRSTWPPSPPRAAWLGLASMLPGSSPRSSRPLHAGRRGVDQPARPLPALRGGRLASAGLSLRLHDPGARGDVRELVRALVERAGLGTVRLYLPAFARVARR